MPGDGSRPSPARPKWRFRRYRLSQEGQHDATPRTRRAYVDCRAGRAHRPGRRVGLGGVAVQPAPAGIATVLRIALFLMPIGAATVTADRYGHLYQDQTDDADALDRLLKRSA